MFSENIAVETAAKYLPNSRSTTSQSAGHSCAVFATLTASNFQVSLGGISVAEFHRDVQATPGK